MQGFADIHSHLLFGVDDGAKTQEDMLAMVDMAYQSGTRFLCATPHYHPGIFGENGAVSSAAFELLRQTAQSKYPDLHLALGNELRYGPTSMDWLDSGKCRTMNETDYVLVDFLQSEPAAKIVEAMHRILNAGYQPILAHAERYDSFGRSWKTIEQLKRVGVLIQVDADSIFGAWDRHAKWMSRALLKRQIADFVCTDAHNLTTRKPILLTAFQHVAEQYGQSYAEALFCQNAKKLLFYKES